MRLSLSTSLMLSGLILVFILLSLCMFYPMSSTPPSAILDSDLDPKHDHQRVLSAPKALKIWKSYQKGHDTSQQPIQPTRTCDSYSSEVPPAQVRLLDARDLSPMYYWAHAPQALHTPWRMFTQGRRSGELIDHQALADQLRSLGICPQDQVLIYGNWSKGWGEEARMLWLLEYAGHERVALIEGGWQAWKAAGGPLERGRTSTPIPSHWNIQWQIQRRAQTEKVVQLLKQKVISFDARSLREYQGETPYGSPVGGRLEHSVHLPWKNLLNEHDQLRSSDELRAIFEQYGARIDAPVFTYCTGGIRSAFIYLALREAGFDQAMNYDGSWWAWSERLRSNDHHKK